jgi:hypothetical protein
MEVVSTIAPIGEGVLGYISYLPTPVSNTRTLDTFMAVTRAIIQIRWMRPFFQLSTGS